MFSRMFLVVVRLLREFSLVARMLPTLSVSMVATQSIISLVHCKGSLLFPGESILTLKILHLVLKLSEVNSLYTYSKNTNFLFQAQKEGKTEPCRSFKLRAGYIKQTV